MPRGAMQAIRVRSARVTLVPARPSSTLTGRTTTTSSPRNTSACGSTSHSSAGEIRPASTTNRLPTNSTCRCSLNSWTCSRCSPGRLPEEHPEDGDGEQPALRLQLIGDHQRADRRGEEYHAVQEVGDGVPAHQEVQQVAERERDPEPDHQGLDQAQQHRGQRVTDAAGQHALEHQQPEHRADRVDHDALPAQQRGDPPGGAQGAQDRGDHGRSGDHEDRADQQRHLDGEPDRERAEGDQRPGDQHGHRAQPDDRPAEVADLADPQAHAALEQDDAHGDRHPGEQHVAAEDPVRLGELAQPEADQQQHQDRGNAQPPRQPLAEHADDDDEGQVGGGGHGLQVVRCSREQIAHSAQIDGSPGGFQGRSTRRRARGEVRRTSSGGLAEVDHPEHAHRGVRHPGLGARPPAAQQVLTGRQVVVEPRPGPAGDHPAGGLAAPQPRRLPVALGPDEAPRPAPGWCPSSHAA